VRTKLVLQRLAELVKQATDSNLNQMNANEKEDFFQDLGGAVKDADEFRLASPAADKARALLEAYVEERMDDRTRNMLEQVNIYIYEYYISKNKKDLITLITLMDIAHVIIHSYG